jgi:amidase
MTAALGLHPAHELAAVVRRREISSRELLDHYLDRIAALNPALNAVVTLDADQARARAAELDELAARGSFVGPLHGLPVTIKDSLATAGLRSTSGAAELKDHVPTTDAAAVASIKRAGAIVFGKTNLPAWSRDVQTRNDMFGTTNNPWDVSRTSGGSSGGSAVAVAAGLTAFDIGADIGGSLRIPAGFCGIFSHKPSYGIVPQDGYLDRLDGGTSYADLNVIGPLARDPRDLHLVLSVIAGPDAHHADGWRLELPPPAHETLPGYRVGVWLDEDALELDAEAAAVMRQAISRLADAGAKIESAKPDIDFFAAVELYHSLVVPAASAHLSEPPPGQAMSHHRWLDLDHRRRRLIAAWHDWFERFDVLLCPVTPMPAFPHVAWGPPAERVIEINERAYPVVFATAWTGMVGVAYLPSSVVPVGRTSAGLPVGMQVVAGRHRDNTALHFATQIAAELDGYRVPPIAAG